MVGNIAPEYTPIWNAIENRDYKQALKTIEKRYSKKPTAYLETLKLYVQAQSVQPGKEGDIIIALVKLSTKSPALTDPDAVELAAAAAEVALPNLSKDWGDYIGILYSNLAKTLPKDEETNRAYFLDCLSHGDYKNAQAISTSLQNNFNKNREYHLWNITTMFLFSLSPRYSAKDRKTQGSLALFYIKKLATATMEAGNTMPRSNGTIHTSQELLLLHQITRSRGTVTEQLVYLRNQYLGPESLIAGGEVQFWRLFVELLTDTKQWRELFDITSKLLKRARTKDTSGKIHEGKFSDWVFWKALIKSALNLDQESINMVYVELEAHMNLESGLDSNWRRNAVLASANVKFDLSANKVVTEGGLTEGHRDSVHDQFAAIQDYMSAYGYSDTAYTDIRPFLELIDVFSIFFIWQLVVNGDIPESTESPESVSAGFWPQVRSLKPLNQNVTTVESVTRLTNTYKMIYLLGSSVPEHKRQSHPRFNSDNFFEKCRTCGNRVVLYCSVCLRNLARATLSSYGEALKAVKDLPSTDRHPADNLCILTAMCMMKVSISKSRLFEPDHNLLLNAALLLEYAWSNSKANPQLSLMLIKLYCYLGCASLALRAFQRLDLKQIQKDTLSHTMFDRISSLHPHKFRHQPLNSPPLPDPLVHFHGQLDMYRSAHKNIRKQIRSAYEKGSYNSALEMEEVEDNLRNNLAQVMVSIECRKITRLTETSLALSASSFSFDKLAFDCDNQVASIKTSIYDTNDYLSYPSFECSQQPAFMTQIFAFLPQPTIANSKASIRGEALRTVLDGDMSVDKLLIRKFEAIEESPEDHKVNQIAAESERLVSGCNDLMCYVLVSVYHTQKLGVDIQRNAHSLLRLLKTVLREILFVSSQVPTSQVTIMLLYLAHETGITAMKFSKKVEELLGPDTDMSAWKSLKIHESGQMLTTEVVTKSQVLKAQVNAHHIDGEFGRSFLRKLGHREPNEKDSSMNKEKGRQESDEKEENRENIEVGIDLSEVIPYEFMNEWFSEMVESWKDTIGGLALLKDEDITQTKPSKQSRR